MYNYEIVTMFKIHENNFDEILGQIDSKLEETFSNVLKVYDKNHPLAYLIQNEKSARYIIFTGVLMEPIDNKLNEYLSEFVKKGFILRFLIRKVRNFKYYEVLKEKELLKNNIKFNNKTIVADSANNKTLSNDDTEDEK